MFLSKKTALAAAALGLVMSLPAAATNLVVDGNFNNLTYSNGNTSASGGGQLGYNIEASGWTAVAAVGSSLVPADGAGYSFIFKPGAADTTGVTDQYGSNLQIWGQNNGGNSTAPAPIFNGDAPNGGNIVALEGDLFSKQGAITQTITNMVIGETYTLSFWWAAAQQQGFNGSVSESMTVTLGDKLNATTASETIASHGFGGWVQETYSFKADATSAALSFIANGSVPVPPFALLSDVSLSIPEPEMLALFGIGLLAMSLASRQKSDSFAA